MRVCMHACAHVRVWCVCLSVCLSACVLGTPRRVCACVVYLLEVLAVDVVRDHQPVIGGEVAGDALSDSLHQPETRHNPTQGCRFRDGLGLGLGLGVQSFSLWMVGRHKPNFHFHMESYVLLVVANCA